MSWLLCHEMASCEGHSTGQRARRLGSGPRFAAGCVTLGKSFAFSGPVTPPPPLPTCTSLPPCLALPPLGSSVACGCCHRGHERIYSRSLCTGRQSVPAAPLVCTPPPACSTALPILTLLGLRKLGVENGMKVHQVPCPHDRGARGPRKEAWCSSAGHPSVWRSSDEAAQ